MNKKTKKNSSNEQISVHDIAILDHLLRDARCSLRELARRTKLSLGTVANRVKRLEELGVIKGYTALLDYERLGYDLVAIIELSVIKGKLLEVQRRIAHDPHVICVYDVTGVTDAIVIAKFRTRRELNDFIKAVLKMEEVERTNTHIALNVVKEDLRLPPGKTGVSEER